MIDVEDLYAALVECSDDAIVAKDLDGIVIAWNPAAERLFGFTAAEMKGVSNRRLLPPDRQYEEDTILARICTGEQVGPLMTKRLHKSGRLLDIVITASPLRNSEGEVVGLSTIARNARPCLEQQRLLRESEERFRTMADNISQLAWIARPDGSLAWYNKRWYEYTGASLEEMEGWGWRMVHHPDHVGRVEEGWRRALLEQKDWDDTFPMRSANGDYRWFLSHANPIRDASGRIRWWFGTHTDITEQREHDEQVRLLLLEVNHRSKNLLATVQALARRTAPDDAGFIARFEERLRSLAINQDILVRREWREVPLTELVALQLAFVEAAPGDITAGGSDCWLIPRAAEVVGMALHELATNSLKYGALSVTAGRVSIGWDCAPECRHFQIWWQESGGPPVIPPTGRGFGTTLIRDMPRHNLGAEVTLEYNPEGLRWSLTCDAGVVFVPARTMAG